MADSAEDKEWRGLFERLHEEPEPLPGSAVSLFGDPSARSRVGRSPRAFLDAVSSLIQDGRIPASSIRLVFAGDAADGHLPEAPGPDLAGVLTAKGRVSHREALAWMCRADLLCLFAQGQPEQIPAKAFEYLAGGPPILAITGEGATGDLVLKSGGSVVSDEPWAIAEAIHQHYLAWRAEGGAPRPERPWARAESRPFDRKVLAARLASLIRGESA